MLLPVSLLALLASSAGAAPSEPHSFYQQKVLTDLPSGDSDVSPAAIYDYIVVGGGTAGITVASRLAENHFSVALVEAGGLYQVEFPLAAIPAAANIGSGADINRAISPIDWKFIVKNVPGTNYRDIHYPRGRCLGGSYV